MRSGGRKWEETEERLEKAIEAISYGKISGAVGTYTHTSPELEEFTLNRLGLKPEPIINTSSPERQTRRISFEFSFNSFINRKIRLRDKTSCKEQKFEN